MHPQQGPGTHRIICINTTADQRMSSAKHMLTSCLLIAALLMVPELYAQERDPAVSISSPDGRIAVHVEMGDQGVPFYRLLLNGKELVERSPLGLVTSIAWWDRDLSLVDAGSLERVEDQYVLRHGKQSDVSYEANRRVVRLVNPDNQVLDVVFQVSNDGLAFQYQIPQHDGVAGHIQAHRELTGFRFSIDTRSWLMPMDHPLTGFANTNPSYEAHYTPGDPVGASSPRKVGWAFPGLFQREGVGWALVTEAGLEESFVGTRLVAEAERGLYRISFPDRGEGTGPNDPTDPSFELPFDSPWRVIIVGETPGPIIESTLVTDVSAPEAFDGSWIRPGKAGWSWLPLKDDSVVPDVQHEFVDMAAEYGFEYVLVDAHWDVQIGYDGIQELTDYARSRGVEIIVWYNSNGNYNDAPQSPHDRMHEETARREEFARIQEIGITGVKVDFLGGDKQSVIKMYLDILRDAADHGITVNFHGATLPRGWNRTYPNYVTAEAVHGYEMITFDQGAANLAPGHGTVLPFTRNVVGPMDFTPTMLTDTVGTSIRRTSNAYDLAMLVVFESGIQHLGITPDVMADQPDFVTSFISDVPAAWDETRFVEGFPGDYVVIARRLGNRWFVGGLNGNETPKSIRLNLPFLDGAWSGTIIKDGADIRSYNHTGARPGDEVTMLGNGGFVLMINE